MHSSYDRDPLADSEDLSSMSRAQFIKLASGFGAALFGADRLVSVASAATEKVESKFPIFAPAGVEQTRHPAREAAQALKLFDRHAVQWNGVIVLLPPKTHKNVQISFTQSPTAYYDAIMVNNEFSTVEPVRKGEKARDITLPIAISPGLLNFKGRLYAITYDDDSGQFGFLDIAWAHQNRALGLLEIEHTKAAPYKSTNRYALEPQPADLITLELWHAIIKTGHTSYGTTEIPLRLGHTVPHL